MPHDDARSAFRIADLELDPGKRRLSRGAERIELPAKSFDVLVALARAAPDGLSHDQLIDAAWHGRTVSSSTVAKRIELLRQALGDDSASPRYIGLVHGYGYRLVATVRESQSRADDKTPGRQWPLTAGIAALALVAAGLFWFRPEPDVPADRTVAVLPFAVGEADADTRALTNGLTDELRHQLSSEAGLRVTGRSSSLSFGEAGNDIRDAGRELGVAHVLEGSVQRSGDRLKITAQLVSASDGFSVWSDVFDSAIDDIIDVQRAIATAVAAELDATIRERGTKSDAVDPTTIAPATYANYLRAVSLSPYGKSRGLDEAQRLIELVTEEAPGFAPGWNRLAAIHGRRLFGRDPNYEKSPEESLAIAMHAIGQAIAIDPDSAEAYAGLGGAAWVFEGNTRKAAPLIERALALDPFDLDIVSFAADFAKVIGRLDEALELEEQIVARDPLCDECRRRLAKSYLYVGRPADALRQYEVLFSPEDGNEWNVGIALLMLGRPAEALESFDRIDEPGYLKLLGLAAAHCDLERTAAAEALLERLAAEWGEAQPQDVAMANAHCGNADAAFEWLEGSLPEGTIRLQNRYPEPFYDPIRNDPRWQAILVRIERAPEQLRQIPFSLVDARRGLSQQ